jgi:acetyl esterase
VLCSVLALVATGALLAGVAACTGTPTGDSDQTVAAKPVIYPMSLRYHGIETVSDVQYGSDPLQRLDVCLPAGAATTEPSPSATAASGPTPNAGDGAAGDGAAGAAADGARSGSRAAVLMVHGGSWSHGDKATAAYHAVCQYLASQGFVVFNTDYRLAPTDPYPAGLDDVRRALDWVFRPANLAAYDVDSRRVGVFGGSAGGNLAALLAIEDHDSTAYADGDRIRAVVDLSGPTDLTAASTEPGGVSESFQRKQLLYLGCDSYTDCPAARRASPLHRVTQRTAPFFIGASTDEFIPQWESRKLASALRGAGTSVTFVSVTGTAHSIAQLDEAMSKRVVAFLRAHLG